MKLAALSSGVRRIGGRSNARRENECTQRIVFTN